MTYAEAVLDEVSEDVASLLLEGRVTCPNIKPGRKEASATCNDSDVNVSAFGNTVEERSDSLQLLSCDGI